MKASSIITNSIFAITDTINMRVSDKEVRNQHSQNGNIDNLFNVINNTNKLWGIQKFYYSFLYDIHQFTVEKIVEVVKNILGSSTTDSPKTIPQKNDFGEISRTRRNGFENPSPQPVVGEKSYSTKTLNHSPKPHRKAQHIPVGIDGVIFADSVRAYKDTIMRLKNSSTDQQKQKTNVANFINKQLPIDQQQDAKKFAKTIGIDI